MLQFVSVVGLLGSNAFKLVIHLHFLKFEIVGVAPLGSLLVKTPVWANFANMNG